MGGRVIEVIIEVHQGMLTLELNLQECVDINEADKGLFCPREESEFWEVHIAAHSFLLFRSTHLYIL